MENHDSKFILYGGGTWRELNTKSGNVSGWGKAMFVYFHRGRLIYVKRRTALKGLQALEAGHPTTIFDGPKVPRKRLRKKAELQPTPNPGNASCVHHCSCQCSCTNHSKLSKENTAYEPRHNSYIHCCFCQRTCTNNNQTYNAAVHFTSVIGLNTNSVGTQCDNITETSTKAAVEVKTVNQKQKDPLNTINKTSRLDDETSKGENQKYAKELSITEEDIVLLRQFIKRDDKNLGVTLEDYDASDENKRKLLYKINPLVRVTRNRCIAEMVSRSLNAGVSLKQFTQALGLQSVNETSKKSAYKMRSRKPNRDVLNNKDSIDNVINKENISKPTISSNNNKKPVDKPTKEADVKKKNHRRRSSNDKPLRSRKIYNGHNREYKFRSDSQSSDEKNFKISKKRNNINHVTGQKLLRLRSGDKGTVLVNKRLNPVGDQSISKAEEEKKKQKLDASISDTIESKNGKSMRMYSRAEEESILAWLSSEGRENLVNGNRLWKQLEPIHHTTTGHFRSWQSLRNRYLRYILPTLGSYALTPATAQQLRAAAAAGEIKRNSGNRKLNCSVVTSSLRSAMSRRARSPLRSPGPPPPLASVTGYESVLATTPNKGTESRDSSLTEKRSPTSPISPTRKKRTRRQSIPSYSQLTRRFALRHRSTPRSSGAGTSVDSVDTRARPSRTSTSRSAKLLTSSGRERPKKRHRADSFQSDSTSSSQTETRSMRSVGSITKADVTLPRATGASVSPSVTNLHVSPSQTRRKRILFNPQRL